jgi:hypothetical protein
MKMDLGAPAGFWSLKNGPHLGPYACPLPGGQTYEAGNRRFGRRYFGSLIPAEPLRKLASRRVLLENDEFRRMQLSHLRWSEQEDGEEDVCK